MEVSNELNRREFVTVAIIAGAACCTMTVGGSALASGPTSQPGGGALGPGKFDAGPVVGLSEGLTDKFIRIHKIVVVRSGNKAYAQSAICTHKACTLKVLNDELRCPCHGSRFDNEGKPTKGPATDALCRYGVALVGGRLIVDTNVIILPGDFEKPEAFITIS